MYCAGLIIVKVSPDSFMQVCIQIAFFRIHKYMAAVYETASTRAFLHGRTETCRSLTTQVQNLITELEKKNVNMPPASILKLFRVACESHSTYMKNASIGQGVDRHLLGLRLMLLPGESHALFTHPLFTKSSKWQLSTSALFPGERMYGTGFGAGCKDGYGMNYMIAGNGIKIGVECKRSCGITGSTTFLDILKSVLADMRSIGMAVTGEVKF